MSFRSDKPQTDRLTPSPAADTAKAQRILLLLLFFSAAINYIDRGSPSIVAAVLAIQLSLTPVQLGLLFSAFFWSYTGFMVPAGWISDRYSVKWVLAAGFFLWSIATLGVGFVNTLYALLFMRLILGFGESVAYPCISRIFAT